MEVILKKSKITASILKQSLISVQSDFRKSICLGWVFYLKTRYMVLYDPETKATTKYLVIKSIEKYSPQNNNPTTFMTKVCFYGNYTEKYYESETERDRDIFISSVNHIQKQCEEKGQFFI